MMSLFKWVSFLLVLLTAAEGHGAQDPVVFKKFIRDVVDEAVQQKIQPLSEAILDVKQEVHQLNDRLTPIIEEYEAKQRHDAEVEEAERLQNETQHVREHFEEFSKTAAFLNLSFTRMSEILASDELNVGSEKLVYEGMMRWLRVEGRAQHVQSLLGLIRLMLIDGKYLVNVISEDPLIMQCTPCRSLVKEAIVADLDSKIIPNCQVPALNNRLRRRIRSPKDRVTREVILAIGGQNRRILSSVERFDPLSPGWRSGAPMPSTGAAVGAAVLNNKVYVCGSSYEGMKSCMSYDPMSDSWSRCVADMLEVRHYFAFASLGGALYAVGGSDNRGSVERYNVTTNQWTRRANFSLPVAYQSMVALNGFLYMAGLEVNYEPQASLYRYDPGADSWTRLADMATPRSRAALVAVPSASGGFLYIMGGHTGRYPSESTLDTVERFDVAANRWEAVSRMSEKREHLSAVLVGGNIYAVGGWNSSSILNTVESLSVNGTSGAEWVISKHVLSETRMEHAVVKIEVYQN